MPAVSKLDLNKIVTDPSQQVDITVSSKTPEADIEREHRLSRQTDDAKHERRKNMLILLTVVFGIATILVLCFVFLVNDRTSPEDRKWASTVLTTIVTLGMGYLVGKDKASKSV